MNRREFGARLLGVAGLAVAGGAWRPRGADPGPRVDGGRLLAQLGRLAQHGRNPEGGVSRVAYGEADLAGRALVRELMVEAGLRVEVDLAGNLVGRREGSDPRLRPIGIGSHIDSVPQGGNFDGTVGSLAAIEVARVLAERRVRTRHPLEVLIFQNEEGGKTGSRALDGELEPRELELRTASGLTIREGIRRLGGDPERILEARRAPGSLAAFLELHIEQGAVLDREAIPIGVVQGIVGIKRWEISVEGEANHAGTTPMDGRRDALLAGARVALAVEEAVRARPGTHVGTVGRLTAEPGAPNVVAGVARLSLELRDLSLEVVDALFADIQARAERVAAESGTRVRFSETYVSRPALADPRLQRLVAGAASSLGLKSRPLPSGAGHDAQSMARLAPMAMIFIPSVDGISHSPRELTRPDDVVRGADVLLRALLELDRSGLG